MRYELCAVAGARRRGEDRADRLARGCAALAPPLFSNRRVRLAGTLILRYLSNGATWEKILKDFSLQNIEIKRSSVVSEFLGETVFNEDEYRAMRVA